MIIGGFSTQIKKALDDEKAVQKIDMVLDEVQRLERMVRDLSDFTREYKLIKRQADIHSVLGDVLKIMAGVYSSDKHGFDLHLADDVQEINCDPDKLKQVFINIISNGFEAMTEGGRFTISTEKEDKGIKIKISDNGVGIPEKDLQHIFEPYYTTREKGSGLGLPISYKIIQAHEGDLSAVSQSGKGTTFIIKLPA
jgi:signal transduction histidine kinase